MPKKPTTRKTRKTRKTAQPILQVETWRAGRTVFAKILHQDERLRNQIGDDFSLICYERDGFVVASRLCPALIGNVFWLRGSSRATFM
jgi:hypothetical protein